MQRHFCLAGIIQPLLSSRLTRLRKWCQECGLLPGDAVSFGRQLVDEFQVDSLLWYTCCTYCFTCVYIVLYFVQFCTSTCLIVIVSVTRCLQPPALIAAYTHCHTNSLVCAYVYRSAAMQLGKRQLRGYAFPTEAMSCECRHHGFSALSLAVEGYQSRTHLQNLHKAGCMTLLYQRHCVSTILNSVFKQCFVLYGQTS